jgi:transposase
MAQVWGDDGDGGLGAWRKETLGWERGGVWVLEGQDLPPRPAGFQVLPQRWVVEGTFGWLGGSGGCLKTMNSCRKPRKPSSTLG